MAYSNEVKIKLKKTSLPISTIMEDTESKYILDYGEALYISDHNVETETIPASGNDYLTFGGKNNLVNYDPLTGKSLNNAIETIKKHNQFIKAQTKNRVDRAIFYPDNITPTATDKANNISTQLINDQGINVYPAILPAITVIDFQISSAISWTAISGNIYKYNATIIIPGVTNKTKIDLSCQAAILQTMLTNNIYSLHIENQNGTLYLYAFSYQNPGGIALNLQASLQETYTTATTIIGDGIVASDGNNIEFGSSAPSSSKAKLWINTATGLAYFKNGSNWTNITSAFG